MEIIDITQIWNMFFCPILSVVIVCLFIYFLMGKQYIYDIYQKYKIIKINNKYYRQKHIKVNGNKYKGVIWLPVSKMSEKFIIAIHTPIIFIIFFLLIIYTIYKIINLCSFLYPIKYSFVGEAMLLYSTPKEIVAEIWAYFPEYTLQSLYEKINVLGNDSSYAKYADYSYINIFGSIFKFCSLICIINFFLQKPKIKTYLKTVSLFIVCLFVIVLTLYFQFKKTVNVLEQKAYYVVNQLALDDPSVCNDSYKNQLAIEKVENELSYMNSEMSHGAFSIYFGF